MEAEKVLAADQVMEDKGEDLQPLAVLTAPMNAVQTTTSTTNNETQTALAADNVKEAATRTLTRQRADAHLQEDQATETWDELLWPLMPYFGARVATLQGGVPAFGSISAVDLTTKDHDILYVMEYEDGDLEHLNESVVAAAVLLASNSAPRRELARRTAEAHLRDPY